MWQNAHDAYLESRILSADPIELIRLLYQAAAGAVRDARHQLAAGEIAARSRSITKACEILMELTGSLDHERGGEISQKLAQLYGYMTRRLVEANCQQNDAPLSDVLGLLSTLSEAWNGLKAEQPEPAMSAGPWARTLSQEPASTCGSQAWSL
jgi:flagellar protein FliS